MQEYPLEHFNDLYSKYLNNNIKHFQNITKNIISQKLIKTKLKKHDTIREDALNECIILLSEKIERHYKTNKSLSFLNDQEQFNKYFTTFISNTISWQALDKLNGLDSNIFLTQKNIDEQDYFINLYNDSDNIMTEEYIYIEAEQSDPYTKLYKLDLLNAGLPLKSAEKLDYIKKIKKHLSDYERELFTLYYECEMIPLNIMNTFKNENSPYFKSIHKIRKDIYALKEKIKTIVEIIKDDF